MKKLLPIILLLVSSCEEDTVAPEPEDCAGVAGGSAVFDECGVCDGDGALNVCWDSSLACASTECPEEPFICSFYLERVCGNGWCGFTSLSCFDFTGLCDNDNETNYLPECNCDNLLRTWRSRRRTG